MVPRNFIASAGNVSHRGIPTFTCGKKGTDIGGKGSYSTTGNLVFYKVYHIGGFEFVSVTLSLAYSYATSVHVAGFNAYGGGFRTKGVIHPVHEITAIFSFEYELTRNWVFAFDNVYIQFSSVEFSGERGLSASGSSAQVGNPSSAQLSFAPALEYNFSADFGIIGGIWFAAAGRNAPSFWSAAVNFSYMF